MQKSGLMHIQALLITHCLIFAAFTASALAAELLDTAKDALASSINTTFDEREPFLSQDGRLLLFSSNRFGAYRIYGVYFPTMPLTHPIPAPAGKRSLPEVPWLGGPGDQRNPCLCQDRLFYRSEAEWGAGVYTAKLEYHAITAPAGQERLILSTAQIKPLLQEIGLRLEGPWWLPNSANAGILLAQANQEYTGWIIEDCQVQNQLTPQELAERLPWLREHAWRAVAAIGPGWLLATVPDVRGRLDFAWLTPSPGPLLGLSLVGKTVNTTGWDEFEATGGLQMDGRRLLIFSRDNNPTRRDGNLWAEWLPETAP